MSTNLPNPGGSSGDNYGWIAAAVATALGAIGALYGLVRKIKREDSTKAVTHLNRVIAGLHDYTKILEGRLKEKQTAYSALEDESGSEARDLKTKLTVAMIENERLTEINKLLLKKLLPPAPERSP